jgi:hypothetical protein
MIDVRDKHIAHSVNNLEENRLVVTLIFSGDKPSDVAYIDIEPIRFIPITFDRVAKISNLLKWCRNKADDLFSEERLRLTEFLRTTNLKEMAKFRMEPLPAGMLEESVSKRRPSG